MGWHLGSQEKPSSLVILGLLSVAGTLNLSSPSDVAQIRNTVIAAGLFAGLLSRNVPHDEDGLDDVDNAAEGKCGFFFKDSSSS